VFLDQAAERGQFHGFPAIENSLPQQALQALDAFGKRRLAQVRFAGRLAETPGFNHSQEMLEMARVNHTITTSYQPDGFSSMAETACALTVRSCGAAAKSGSGASETE